MAKAQSSSIHIAKSSDGEPADDEIPLQSGGGGGTFDDMNERVVRLEERTDLFGKQLDRIVTRLDAIDAKLATLPSKEFFLASLITVAISMLAIAITFGLGTFAVADYAAKNAAPSAPVQAAAPQQQPMIIVVPSLSAVPNAPQPAPVAPSAPTP